MDKTQDPLENLSKFYETCQFCCPTGLTESEAKLGLFPLALAGEAKNWLNCFPNSKIKSLTELERKFTGKYFGIQQLSVKRQGIMNFTQEIEESLPTA